MKKIDRRSVLLGATGFLLAGFGLKARGAWRVCPQCGYEVADGLERCGHCGAAVPPKAPADGVPEPAKTDLPAEPPPPASSVGALSGVPEALLADWKAAVAAAQQPPYWLSFLFARNAEALIQLAGPEAPVKDGQVADLLHRLREPLARGEAPCPLCEGKGKTMIRTTTMGGEVIEQELAGHGCPMCEGRGTLPIWLPPEALQRGHTDALRRFTVEQRRRGREEYYGIWLPAKLKDRLTLRQAVTLRKAHGAPCEECLGFGSQACEPCGGAGRVKCSDKDCYYGVLTCPDCKGLGKSTETVRPDSRRDYDRNSDDDTFGRSTGRSTSRTTSRTATVRCERCMGTGRFACPTCKGLGYEPCEPCKASGHVLCPTCQGVGMPPVCKKCGGEGLTACSRCKGSGKYKDGECPYCNGEGQLLCSSCDGTGRTTRRR